MQRIIDRIIFLRICEDRGIETYETLKGLLEGDGVYSRLCALFERADDRYNSGLFHFSDEPGWDEMPDSMTPGLAIDDKVLKEVIKRLYWPESQYQFSVIPPAILGQVYEQFLGKVIRLTDGPPGEGGGQARGEEGGRGLLHAGVHRRLHREGDGGPARGGEDAGGGLVDSACWTRRAARARS